MWAEGESFKLGQKHARVSFSWKTYNKSFIFQFLYITVPNSLDLSDSAHFFEVNI